MKPFLRTRKVSVGDQLGWLSALMIRLDERRPLIIKIGLIASLLLLTAGVTVLIGLKGPLYGMVLTAVPFAIAFILIMEKRLTICPAADPVRGSLHPF